MYTSRLPAIANNGKRAPSDRKVMAAGTKALNQLRRSNAIQATAVAMVAYRAAGFPATTPNPFRAIQDAFSQLVREAGVSNINDRRLNGLSGDLRAEFRVAYKAAQAA